jgi:hypothetical protein
LSDVSGTPEEKNRDESEPAESVIMKSSALITARDYPMRRAAAECAHRRCNTLMTRRCSVQGGLFNVG